jgi:hypothetical protein
MFSRVSSSMRIFLIKEEKQRIIKKLTENMQENYKKKELETYLKYLEEQLKVYPELKSKENKYL